MRSSLKKPKRGAAWGFISRIKPLPRKYKVVDSIPRTRGKVNIVFYKIYKNFYYYYYHYHSKTGSRYVELVA